MECRLDPPPFVFLCICFYFYIRILGPQTPEDSIKFIRKKFDSVNYANPGKTIFMHETCATDSDQIQKIMESVISMIIQHNLKKSGLY